MKVSDFIVDFLVKEKVTHVFEVCGGALAHLLDSLYGRKDIQTISVHHEQAAAIAAEGFARVRGDVGVALATSGPGATNMVTGIASCFFDSIPSVFITGQVNLYEFKGRKPVRQIGFQETDIVKIVRPIVKDAVLLTDASKIKYHLERAFHIARSGRPGPVLLDIPMNIQRSDISLRSLTSFLPSRSREYPKIPLERDVKLAAKKLNEASRPLILVGGGVVLSRAQRALSAFVRKSGIPVVSSLLGRDSFQGHDAFMGMIGTYGNRQANLAVANSDFLLCLGTRLDTRQTGTKPETFAKKAFKVHVDIDPHELNNKVRVDIAIPADIKEFLRALDFHTPRFDSSRYLAWKKAISSWRKKYTSFPNLKGSEIHPNVLLHHVSGFLPAGCILCADVGQNQIWAAQSLQLKPGQRFLTQGGMGTMGSALPMAIGASFAQPNRPVVAITGDGGFQLNIQELQTVFHHRLPIKIILLNNSCYGMVRQFQEQYFHSRFQSTLIGYSCPDFQKVVSAYKIPVCKISRKSEIAKAMKWFFVIKGPAFLEINIPQKLQVLPKLAVDKPIEEQDPALPRQERESLLSLNNQNE